MIENLEHKSAECLSELRCCRLAGLDPGGVGAVMLAVAGTARAFTAEQADKGREVFRLQCARCHGPDGQGISNIYKGMTAPPLIGPAALPLDPQILPEDAPFSVPHRARRL